MNQLLSKEVILDYLRLQRKFLEREFGVEKIALIGSYARGEQSESSDIDLLVTLKEKDFETRMDLKYFLQDHFNVPVDVGYFDGLRTHIRRAVLEDIIYA